MRTLTYAGKDFSEFSCWWDGSQVFEKPAKIAQNYQIPFRNGDLIRSTEAFENVQIRFNCFIKENYEENYSELVNFLNSFDTYQRLETSAEPSIYRMAFLHAVIEPETGQFLKDGQFTIVFDCMPQEWLKSGEEEFSIDMQTNSYTGNPVTYEDGFGDSVVDSLTVEFEPQQDLNGYDYPWAGGSGRNLLGFGGEMRSQTVYGVEFNLSEDGVITANGTAEADGTFDLPTPVQTISGGTYLINGLPSGSSVETFGYLVSYNGSMVGIDANDTEIGGLSGISIFFARGYTFNNAVFRPMVRRSTETDGTWMPYENVCPITGYTEASVEQTGKNLCADLSDYTITSKGITFTFSEGHRITIQGTSNASNADSTTRPFGGTNPKPITFKAGVTYTASISGITETPGIRLFLRKGTYTNMWYGDSTTGVWSFSFAEDTVVDYFMLRVPTSGSVVDIDGYFQIEEGSDATAYEPYQEQIYAPSLGQTVYGGSLDLVSGVLTITKGYADLGDCTWVVYGTSTPGLVYTDTIKSQIGATDGTTTHGICSAYNMVTNTGHTAYVDQPDGSIRFRASDGRIYVKSLALNGMTAVEVKTAMGGVQLVYELAEPQTIQLTPQQISLLMGTNIFSTDISDVAITITEGTTLTNPSYMKARPLIILNGSGTGAVMLNGEEVVYIGTAPSNVPLYIDCETMDCYSISNGETVNENRHVTLPEGYIELQKGDNRFTASGNLEPTMIPRWWRL